MPELNPEGDVLDRAGAAGAGSEPVEPFLKIDDTTSFNSKEDAIKAFSEGTMRHSAYKQKMSEYENNLRKFENDRAAHFRSVSEWDAGKSKRDLYDQLDQVMQSNPAAYRAMMQAVQGTPRGADLETAIGNLLEKKGITKKLDEFEKAEKRRLAEQERDRHFETLGKKYPDFNRDAVLEMYNGIMGEDATMATFIEALHHAVKGKNAPPPEKIKEELLDGMEKKKAAAIPSGRGGSAPSERKGGGSINELREKLKTKYGGN